MTICDGHGFDDSLIDFSDILGLVSLVCSSSKLNSVAIFHH